MAARKKKATPKNKKFLAPEDLPLQPVSSEPLPPLLITQHGATASPLKSRAVTVPYSQELADQIYDMFVGGMSLHKISSFEGMPSYGSILRWYKDNPEFREAIEGGRTLKALHHEEQALKAAEEAEHKDDVPAARLKFDAHVWAAGVNDPDKFGKRTTIAGDQSRPVIFQIITGVPEPDEQKTIELNQDGTVKEVSQ